ncbi:MAG: inverse autotransporter beta domain-containing protein, partial [Verrucomicrobiota bacterium]
MRLPILLFLFVGASFLTPLFAEDSAPIAESSSAANEDSILPQNPEIPWLATATWGWGLNSDISTWQGGGEILAPIWQGDDQLLYVNAWTGFYQRDQHYFSVGAGYRWLNAKDTLFFGLNAFWDHGEVDDLASFDRFGFGVEASNFLIDFRLNGYLAESGRGSDSSQVLGYGPLFASGHSVFQPLTVAGAEAYSGVEFELGRQLPLPENFPFTLGFWAGAYAFDGPDEANSDMDGWRARVELGLTDYLFFDAAYYDDEDFVGGNTYVGLRASIPLGKGARSAAEVGDDSIVENYLRAKLGQRVVRHHRLMHTTSVTENTEIADDLVFVNNGGSKSNGIGAGSSSGNGTAENPLNTVQRGANRAVSKGRSTGREWTVYTQGGGGTYREEITVRGSAAFTSSAIPIVGLDGQTFGTGEMPIISGGFSARDVESVSIDGYRIRSGLRRNGIGIYLEDVANFELSNSLIEDTSGGGLMAVGHAGANGRLKVTQTTIEDTGGDGLAIFGLPGWVGQVTVRDNVLEDNNGAGLRIEVARSTIRGEVSGNFARDNSGNGFDIRAHSDGVINIRVSNNVAQNNANGFRIANERGLLNLDLLNNSANRNRGDGFRIEYPFGRVNSTISGNRATANAGSGFELENDLGLFLGTISNNNAASNGLIGFIFDIATGSQLRADITGNAATGNLGDGFLIFIPQGGLFGDISENTAFQNGDNGIAISAPGRRIIGSIERNIAQYNILDGFNFDFREGTLMGDINGNTAADNGRDGFAMNFSDGRIEGR